MRFVGNRQKRTYKLISKHKFFYIFTQNSKKKIKKVQCFQSKYMYTLQNSNCAEFSIVFPLLTGFSTPLSEHGGQRDFHRVFFKNKEYYRYIQYKPYFFKCQQIISNLCFRFCSFVCGLVGAPQIPSLEHKRVDQIHNIIAINLKT